MPGGRKIRFSWLWICVFAAVWSAGSPAGESAVAADGEIRRAALRYAITNSKDDLAAAKRILLHLSDYSFRFEHYDVGMNYAVWGHLALNAYDILFRQKFTWGLSRLKNGRS